MQLGVADVRRLLEQLSCSQIDEWYSYYTLNPWGYGIEAFRNGQLCSVVVNGSGLVKKPTKPSDFYPVFK